MAIASEAPRVVLIDVLGTLIRLEDPAPRLSRLLAERLAITVDEAQARRALRAEIAYYRANLQRGGEPAGLARLRLGCAEVLREALLDAVGGDGRAAAARLRAASSSAMTAVLLDSLRFKAFPEAGEALAELRGRGILVAAVSNWDCSLSAVLHRAGLAQRLDAIVTSAELGIQKPSPRIFLHALEGLDATAGQALHVGDRMVEDVVGARAAGIRAILIRREPTPAPPGVEVIGSLREVTLALDRERPAPPGA